MKDKKEKYIYSDNLHKKNIMYNIRQETKSSNKI